ncbi:MAG: hypothetical protein JSV89_04275 [Spirochaetaceae bacterium]|nr:MAG: hypothetical protein JSV89_04275 [Spirochaetaceae bacterium]
MKKVPLLLLVLFVTSAGFAQEAGTGSFVPFVSKLKAKAVDSRVLLTWRNPQNFQGAILLYRHTEEIDQHNLNEAVRVARLPADQERYEDSPTDTASYYYAVLIEDSNGIIQELFVPFRNTTSDAVHISVLPRVESIGSQITGIRAVVVEDSVQVSFQSSNSNNPLLLFRGSFPMRSTEDLLEAIAPLQLEAGTTRFVDFPIPGVETYYAVIDAELFKLGKQQLVAGENTTDRAVVVPLEVQRVALPPVSEESMGIEPAAAGEPPAAARSPAPELIEQAPPSRQSMAATAAQPGEQSLASTPLPYLQLQLPGGHRFSAPPRVEDLDPRTQAAISRILSSAPQVVASQTEVVILPEDKNGPPTGESASLQKILEEYLLAGDYQGAESKLQGFLNLRRSPYTEARVRFYLAQAYYFQGLYEEALLEFVLSQGQLYAPVQPWLESCFRRLWYGP